MRQRYLVTAAALFAVMSSASLFAQQVSEADLVSLLETKEFSKVGVGTGTFLSLPVGARATAMGGAFAAVADDPSAMYWNPAGIMHSQGTSFGASYTALFAGISHNYAGLAFPINDSYKVGVSATTLSSGDIEVTDLFNQEGTGGTYTATDMALGVSLGGQLTDQFTFGATGKLVNMSIANVSATGIAFDFGTLYDPGFLGLKVGFVVQNLSAPVKYTGPDLVRRGEGDQETGNREPDVQLEASTVSLPLIFRAGVSSELLRDDEMNDLVASAQFTTTSNAPELLGLGVEYTWKDMLAARVGYQFGGPDAFGITGGVGLKYESGSFNGMLDYAIRPHTNLGLVHTITASLRLQ